MESASKDSPNLDPRSTDELVQLALTETDEHAAWEPITVLHFRGTRDVLETAERLCASSIAKERILGVDILGQLGIPDRTFPADCFECLARMLPVESAPDVLQSIAIAFGHLHDPRCINLLIPLKTHPDADVRFGVVSGMSGHDHQVAIETLIELSGDPDEDVRDWSTFGLGTLVEADSPEIREALWARVTDTGEDIRREALLGLARRKDSRVIEPLLRELNSENVGTLHIEAAHEIGDPRLLPALTALKDWWPGDSVLDKEWLDEAIASCNTSSATQAN